MSTVNLLLQDSGDVERYTPEYIIAAVRATLGGIDLDPASCDMANRTVQATSYYTQNDDGLTLPWFGRVFVNWPFSRKHNAAWVNKFVGEYEQGRVSSACCICFASTSESWFQPLFNYPLAFISPRVDYLSGTGKGSVGAPKGSVVAYLGDNVALFADSFSHLCRNIMLPYGN